MTDYLDPEAPVRLEWDAVYMGEGHPYRCGNCSATERQHIVEDGRLLCAETFLRMKDGDR